MIEITTLYTKHTMVFTKTNTEEQSIVTTQIIVAVLFTESISPSDATQSTTQEYITTTIQSSSSKMTANLTTNAAETTTKISKVIPSTVSIDTTETTTPITEKTVATTVMDTTVTTTTDATTSMTTASEIIEVTEKSSTVFSTPTSSSKILLLLVTQIIIDTSETSLVADCNIVYAFGNKNINITTTEIARPIKEDTAITYYTKTITPEFDYVVRDTKTEMACILTNMKIRINLQYVTNNNQTSKVTLTVPANAKITGICDEKIAEMTLRWKEVESQVDSNDKENRITFHYARNDTKSFLDSISIDVHLDSNNFPHAQQKRMKGETADRRLQLFCVSVKDGLFICKADTIVNAVNQIDVVISDICLIAFNECIQNCSRTDGVVMSKTITINIDVIIRAIIIGIILILSLIYLTWYLIWCARSKNLAEKQKLQALPTP